MPLKPLCACPRPAYPDRSSTVARELARAATVAGAALLLACGASQQKPEDVVAPPGEPPLTQLEEEADEADDVEETHEVDEGPGPDELPGIPPSARLLPPRA